MRRARYAPQIHGRRSIRIPGYDYAWPGAYFVTICVRDRECLLGYVVDGRVVLNDLGRIVQESWTWLANQYPCVTLADWIVMPNHLHGIVVITDDSGCRGGSRTAPTGPDRPARKPLGRLIGAFKMVSTRRINALRDTIGTPFWQRNYYERIIRSYIVYNPLNWDSDEDNPRMLLPGR